MKFQTAALAGALALAIGGLAFAQAPQIDPARVDSMVAEVLRQADQDPNQNQKTDGKAIRESILTQLQTFEILKNEAFKVGLDKDADVQNQFKTMEAQFYANQYAQYLERNIEISDDDLYRFYEQQTRMIQLQQVQFNSADEAKAAQALLLKGLSFEELMKRYPNADQKFNQFIAANQMPPQLAAITAQMVRGDVSREPIAINGKFFLFKLSAVQHSPNAQPFELVKSQIATQMKQQKVREKIQQLLKENGITATP